MSDAMTKERPILFSGEMVRAILSGAKTQTRRIVKPQPPAGCVYKINGRQSAACCYSPECDPRGDGTGPCWVPPTATSKDHLLPCPYGSPGERLWVREKWRACGAVYHDMPTPELSKRRKHGAGEVDDAICYAADEYPNEHPGTYRPSIHMPRWASRITLEITDVGVERLNGITPADARAEGITDGGCLNCGESEPCSCSDPEPDPVDAFIWLWESINGKDAWIDNPWVWVVKFRRIEQ